MANLLFASAREAFLRGALDLTAQTIRVGLIDTADYTLDAGHASLADVPAAARVATVTLSAKTVTGGVFAAADVTFGAVTGDAVGAVLLWAEGASDTLSPLIAYFDTDLVGFPVTPDGGDIILTWSPSGVFAL